MCPESVDVISILLIYVDGASPACTNLYYHWRSRLHCICTCGHSGTSFLFKFIPVLLFVTDSFSFSPFSGRLITAWYKTTITSGKSVLTPITLLLRNVVGFSQYLVLNVRCFVWLDIHNPCNQQDSSVSHRTLMWRIYKSPVACLERYICFFIRQNCDGFQDSE